jgi:hypothetical protein
MGPFRVVAGEPVKEFGVPRSAGSSLHLGAGMAAKAVDGKFRRRRPTILHETGHVASTSCCKGFIWRGFFVASACSARSKS